MELWIASLQVTHANPSASPASVVDKTILGTFGHTSIELLAKWNRQSYFSKTCPAISALDSRRSPETLKAWATKLRRDCLRRRKSAQATNGSGSSSSRWQTIKASDGEKGGPNQKDGKGNPYLPMQAALWPTPRAITGGAESAARKKELGRTESGGGDLQAAAQLWPTPATRDYRTPNSRNSQQRRSAVSKRGPQLSNFASHDFSLPDPTNSTNGGKCSKSTQHLPRLNPLFVCWLMGWPRIAPGGFGFTATEWSRFKRRMRSAFCGLLSGLTSEGPHA